MARPLHMEIGLRWYRKSKESKWTYDLTIHKMVNLEASIAICASLNDVCSRSNFFVCYILYWLNKFLIGK